MSDPAAIKPTPTGKANPSRPSRGFELSTADPVILWGLAMRPWGIARNPGLYRGDWRSSTTRRLLTFQLLASPIPTLILQGKTISLIAIRPGD